MTSKNRQRSLLLNSLLLLVYAGFFAVQGVINFEAVPGHELTAYNGIQPSGFHTQQSVGKDKKNQPLKSKMRLNKRFQPSFIPSIQVIAAAIPIPVISWKNPPCIRSFVSDPLLSILLRRGPPGVYNA